MPLLTVDGCSQSVVEFRATFPGSLWFGAEHLQNHPYLVSVAESQLRKVGLEICDDRSKFGDLGPLCSLHVAEPEDPCSTLPGDPHYLGGSPHMTIGNLNDPITWPRLGRFIPVKPFKGTWQARSLGGRLGAVTTSLGDALLPGPGCGHFIEHEPREAGWKLSRGSCDGLARSGSEWVKGQSCQVADVISGECSIVYGLGQRPVESSPSLRPLDADGRFNQVVSGVFGCVC